MDTATRKSISLPRRGLPNPDGTPVRGPPPKQLGYDLKLEDAEVQVDRLVRPIRWHTDERQGL
jgi:hypothetical protein